MAKEIILGIDLGTTNSVVSYMQADGKVKVIPSALKESDAAILGASALAW